MKICVIGGGRVGHDIARILATANISVSIMSVEQARNNRDFIQRPEESLLESLKPTTKQLNKMRNKSIKHFMSPREVKGLPGLPFKQTYEPPVHNKSKKW